MLTQGSYYSQKYPRLDSKLHPLLVPRDDSAEPNRRSQRPESSLHTCAAWWKGQGPLTDGAGEKLFLPGAPCLHCWGNRASFRGRCDPVGGVCHMPTQATTTGKPATDPIPPPRLSELNSEGLSPGPVCEGGNRQAVGRASQLLTRGIIKPPSVCSLQTGMADRLWHTQSSRLGANPGLDYTSAECDREEEQGLPFPWLKI